MGKAIITDLDFRVKNTRSYYHDAYSDLRLFYRACLIGQGSYTEAELIDAKYRLWLKHGKYLDLAWQHYFALHVAWATGKGISHGWVNMLRCHHWNHRQLSFGEFQHVHSEWL